MVLAEHIGASASWGYGSGGSSKAMDILLVDVGERSGDLPYISTSTTPSRTRTA